MPLGSRALDPNTEYHVYEYAWRGRVFYVGISWSAVRSHGRWSHVKNLVHHEQAGTLKPGKRQDLERKSNQVIASLIRAGLPPHEVQIAWRGYGRDSAEQAETERILELVSAGHLLANEAKNPKPSSLNEILKCLGVKTA